LRLQTPVLVPELTARSMRSLGMIDLHEAHAPFDEPSRHEALPAEDFRRRVVQAVQALRRLGLPIDAERIRRLRLHAERQLEGLNAGAQAAVIFALLKMQRIQGAESRELLALLLE